MTLRDNLTIVSTVVDWSLRSPTTDTADISTISCYTFIYNITCIVAIRNSLVGIDCALCCRISYSHSCVTKYTTHIEAIRNILCICHIRNLNDTVVSQVANTLTGCSNITETTRNVYLRSVAVDCYVTVVNHTLLELTTCVTCERLDVSSRANCFIVYHREVCCYRTTDTGNTTNKRSQRSVTLILYHTSRSVLELYGVAVLLVLTAVTTDISESRVTRVGYTTAIGDTLCTEALIRTCRETEDRTDVGLESCICP